MKKSLAAVMTASLLACTTLFLLSACSFFQGSDNIGIAASGQDGSLYRGTIGNQQADAKVHYAMGCVFQERNKHRLAVTEFETAVDRDPAHVAAYNGLGVSLDALGDYTKAQAAYRAALAIDPTLAYVLNNLGYSYLLEGRYQLAIDSFQKAVSLESDNPRYRNNIGLAQAKNGDYEAALATFRSTSNEAGAHLNVARLYYREGLYDQAAFHFSRAANLKPADTETTKGFVAASTLAQIHAAGQDSTEKETFLSIEPTSQQTAWHDNGGFTTIPAGAIEEPDIVEVDRVGMADANRDPGNLDSTPIYTVTLARTADQEQERADTRATLDDEQRRILDESQALEVLGSKANDPTRRPANRIRIEVSNGNGVRHMAKNVGNYLSGKGFILMYLANADHFNHAGTSIYYTREYLNEAYRLSQELPGFQTLEEVPVVRNGNAEISVIIGRDLRGYLSMFEQG